jgi:hypothetical protein
MGTSSNQKICLRRWPEPSLLSIAEDHRIDRVVR